MSEHYISYRDYDENDFDIEKMEMEDLESTRSLITQALKAEPSNDAEKELLGEYLDTLRQMLSAQTEFNEAKSRLNKIPPAHDRRSASMTLDLVKSAKSAAVSINYIDQRLFVLEMSEELQNMLKKEKKKNTTSKKTDRKPKRKKLHIEGVLSVLWYTLTVGWFGYIGRIIAVANINIIIKIMLFIGVFVYGFYVFVTSVYGKDDE